MSRMSSVRARACLKCHALIAAMSLAACATETSSPVALCPDLSPYTPEFQAAAADQLDALPEGSALSVLVEDYLYLRDRIRAGCG